MKWRSSKKCVGTTTELMDKANARFAWDEQEEAQRKNLEEEEKDEKEYMAQIDWHDFVVVETINFTAEDENIPLAAPIDVSTGAPKGNPVPLEGAGTMTAEARIEKPKGIEEEEQEEAQANIEKEEAEKKAREQKEKEKEKEEREREEREREERERAEKEKEL